MKREQFLSRRCLSSGRPLAVPVGRYCRKTGRVMVVDTAVGKGSHAGLAIDGRKTIVKSGELTPKEIRTLLKQLNLPPRCPGLTRTVKCALITRFHSNET